MRDRFWLFIVVGKAALITILGWFGLVLGVVGSKIAMTSGEQQILKATIVLLVVFVPAGIATWWIFRKLQARYTRREARAAATAFGVFTPVSLSIATVLSQIPGGYSASLGRAFAVIGAFVGVVVMTTILDFLVCLFTLSMTRRIVKLESTH
jgi:hypothetical protein